MKSTPYFAAGRFRAEGDRMKVMNPYTGKQVGSVVLAGPEVLDGCIRAGMDALEVLSDTPLHQRSQWLAAIAGEMENSRETLAEILMQESGKPIRLAMGETDRAIQTFRIATQEVLRQPGEYMPVDWTPAGEGKEAWIRHFPAGIVAGISPFNFPLNLSAHKIAPALAAGCPIILKPSSSTPLSALAMAGAIQAAGLPAGSVSVLPMKREHGDLLVTDPRFAVLSFTGSPEVGWSMKSRAGKKKVILELGGNAGVIITPSSDLDLAVNKCVSGGFAYSGQVCIHTQRIFVHREVFDAFSTAFVKAVNRLKAGDPADQNTDISVMIDEANAIRVASWLEEATREGATILTGGQRQGSYLEPTVVTNTKPHMKICELEIFGPVVTLEPYDTLDEAIGWINEGRYGLQAGIFTRHIDEMNQAFRNLQVGGVILNDVPTFRVDHMPYGGVKDSGMGREGVRYAMLEMMEPRILVKPMI